MLKHIGKQPGNTVKVRKSFYGHAKQERADQEHSGIK